MKQCVVTLVMMLGVCAGLAKDAHAQTGTWADRGYLNIGFGVESGSSSMTATWGRTDARGAACCNRFPPTAPRRLGRGSAVSIAGW